MTIVLEKEKVSCVLRRWHAFLKYKALEWCYCFMEEREEFLFIIVNLNNFDEEDGM